jgi:hypothetical protein
MANAGSFLGGPHHISVHEHQPAMYALLRLHATLGDKIKENRQEARRFAEDMKHVEGVQDACSRL